MEEQQTIEQEFAVAAKYQTELWRSRGKPLPAIAPDETPQITTEKEIQEPS